MLFFDKKIDSILRREYHEDINVSGYTVQKNAFPFAIVRLNIVNNEYANSKISPWFVINRFSGQQVSTYFARKSEAELWFDEFSKIIDMKDINLLNPKWRHPDGFKFEADKASRVLFYNNYRKYNFETY